MDKGFFTMGHQIKNLRFPAIPARCGRATPPFAARLRPAAATPGGASRAKSVSPSFRPHSLISGPCEVCQ